MGKPGNQITVKNTIGYKTEIITDNHTMISDERADAGGTDLGPNPYELLLSALGACKAITVRMYASRKKIPLQDIIINLYHNKIHAEDCQDCESKEGKIDMIDVEINFKGDLDDEQRKRLLEISGLCPVHKTLTSEIKIETSLIN